jgi:hypothetical protein
MKVAFRCMLGLREPEQFSRQRKYFKKVSTITKDRGMVHQKQTAISDIRKVRAKKAGQ